MALYQLTSFLTFQFVGTSQNRKTLYLPKRLFHTSRIKTYSPLRTTSCLAGAILEDGKRETSPLSTSISSIFVKGFPDSVSEGRLKKVFSEFGQVTNVKIIINERTRQSLGYGYVWFNTREDAKLAVEAMNGKVSWHWCGSSRCRVAVPGKNHIKACPRNVVLPIPDF